MSEQLPVGEHGPHRLVVVRHGSTAWSANRRHTGRTDLPLDADGEVQARAVGPMLASWSFARVFTSPLTRAVETCRLAGYAHGAEVVDDLVEWDYGSIEGQTTAEIRREQPDWSIWIGGAPGGETLAEVAGRADRVIRLVRLVPGDVVCFAHAHLLRILAARWIGATADAAEHLLLGPGSIGVLGWEREAPAIERWNVDPVGGLR